MVGEFGEVLVLDWGVAKLTGVFGRRSDPFSGAVVGTPTYMAPEQTCGDGLVDERTDVFALGTMLDAIAASPPLEAIARKARSPDPQARYNSVQALAVDVSRFIAGMAVHAHRERAVDRLRRFGRRYRLPILLILAYVVTRVLLLWLLRV